MRKQITNRQKQLLSIIYQYIKDTGYPPTFEEMREELGVSSNQSIVDLLEKLERSGCIRKEESAARGISILPTGYEELGEPALAPFVGASAAGMPLQMEEIQGEWQDLGGVRLLKEEVVIAEVKGDSMINAGLLDGSKVLVKKQSEFYTGDIVLARLEDSTTIKRFISDDQPPFVYLKPENPDHHIIQFTNEMEMIGKVISVYKFGQWVPVK